MTAVVAILNKRGLAIAADSAVTRSRRVGNKISKNGNKMVRMSNVVPISVMITGNGSFFRTPWDIIVRQYRLRRGDIPHETVEACIHDFFRFIADNHLFCEKYYIEGFVDSELTGIYENIAEFINCDIESIEEQIDSSERIICDFKEMLQQQRDQYLAAGVCPQFKEYSASQFHQFAAPIINDCLRNYIVEANDFYYSTCFPKVILDAIQEDLESTLLARLTTRRYNEYRSAELVFSGFGAEQDYPSLVPVSVHEGFEDRVNYHYNPQDVVNINDERPAAICSFAQDDIIESLLRGVHVDFLNEAKREVHDSISPFFSTIITPDDLETEEAGKIYRSVDSSDLVNRFCDNFDRHSEANREEWVKALLNYDLPSMAALAKSLIDLTGFHRILTFSEEGVGGPVDLAVVTKNDGFVWLNRKSWYHHKESGGIYGNLGV